MTILEIEKINKLMNLWVDIWVIKMAVNEKEQKTPERLFLAV
jgi:hypothetical protein